MKVEIIGLNDEQDNNFKYAACIIYNHHGVDINTMDSYSTLDRAIESAKKTNDKFIGYFKINVKNMTAEFIHKEESKIFYRYLYKFKLDDGTWDVFTSSPTPYRTEKEHRKYFSDNIGEEQDLLAILKFTEE